MRLLVAAACAWAFLLFVFWRLCVIAARGEERGR
jgi:hypothetical protein